MNSRRSIVAQIGAVALCVGFWGGGWHHQPRGFQSNRVTLISCDILTRHLHQFAMASSAFHPSVVNKLRPSFGRGFGWSGAPGIRVKQSHPLRHVSFH